MPTCVVELYQSKCVEVWGGVGHIPANFAYIHSEKKTGGLSRYFYKHGFVPEAIGVRFHCELVDLQNKFNIFTKLIKMGTENGIHT